MALTQNSVGRVIFTLDSSSTARGAYFNDYPARKEAQGAV